MKTQTKPTVLLDDQPLPDLIPFAERPEAQADFEWLRHLRHGRERLKLSIDSADISAAFRSHPNHNRRGDLELRQVRNAKRIAEIPPISDDFTLPASAQEVDRVALDALRDLDHPVKWGQDPLSRLRAAIEPVEEAFNHQNEVVAKIRADLSAVENQKLVAEHHRRVLARYRAAQEFSRAFAHERALTEMLPAAGYDVCPWILEGASVRSALMLGSESDPNSEIAEFRRWLEDKGLIG